MDREGTGWENPAVKAEQWRDERIIFLHMPCRVELISGNGRDLREKDVSGRDTGRSWFTSDFASSLGAAHKRRPQPGGLSSADIWKASGFFRCRRPHFLVQKNSGYSKFMACSHGQGKRRIEPLRKSWEGSILCGRFLSTFICKSVQHGPGLITNSDNL